MQILKFGGTSVADADNMKKVAAIAGDALQHDKTVIVVSAIGGATDALLYAGNAAADGEQVYKEALQQLLQRHLDMIRALLPVTNQSSMLSWVMQQFNEIEDIALGIYILRELSDKSKDRLVSYGELISSRILSAYFTSISLDNQWKDTRELIKTDSSYTRALVDFSWTNKNCREYFDTAATNLFVVPGFIASDEAGSTTTLGRGGSDYTAAILGAALHASKVEIWTDVSGMMTADPRAVPNARAIRMLSYQETMELSHFGAKVIYPPTIQPLMNSNIPVLIRNTFAPDEEGTLIQAQVPNGHHMVRGISSINRIALLSLEGSGMVGIPGFSKRLFEALANSSINVILITQASSEHSICVGVEESYAEKAKKTVDKAFEFEIESGRVNPLVVEKGLAVIALVGDNMKAHVGVSGRMFSALGRNGVNIRAIAQGSSERNITAVIADRDEKKAINVLHEDFFETTYKQINLFIAGTGNVGSRLLAQLKQQISYLQQNLRLQVRIVGLANSRKMVFNDEGINLTNWRRILDNGEEMQPDHFFDTVKSKNVRNAIFVDITASDKIAGYYADLFKKNIAVVACNKIACSAPYDYYKKLKDLSSEYSVSFLFETNVGAGLPVIGTLNDLLRSGDKVNRIEAVLSGTLNFVFNHYNGQETFASVVRQAQAEGYTEPDPRLDLGGTDVMRKIMILAREAGATLEMADIRNDSFMPASCMEGSVDQFYSEMERQEAHFKALYEAAQKENAKLKFVASFENGKAAVGLQRIPAQHDFYHLYGKDNIVLFYTDRYPDQPLVVKGAGAGADVTAAGVFADVIRAARV